MSETLVINLTNALGNEGVPMNIESELKLDNNLLTYPSAVFNSVKVQFSVVFNKPNVRVYGTITCDISGLCDRCCEPTCNVYTLPFDQTFIKDGSDEDGYCYYDSMLDATKAVQDEIVLSLPTSFLCSDSCKGLCPKCGVNLNNNTCNCDLTVDNVFSVLKNIKF